MKELFTIPEDQKATEQAFRRVLVSTICCTILCMACLAGTTWAWFTVDIVNEGNEIQIASATAQIYVNNQLVEDSCLLKDSDNNAIVVELTESESSAGTPVYVLMYVTQGNSSTCYYFTFYSGTRDQLYLNYKSGVGESVSFQLAWIAPAEAIPVEEYILANTDIPDSDSSDETTTPLETTVPVESIPGTTAPEETDTPEETTEPSESE